jgi:hypothetical protein
MVSTRAVERHVVAQLLSKQGQHRRVPLAGTVITGLGLAALLALVLASLPGLPWFALAAALWLCLGLR